jgi:aerobic carbon-monoxide dehydrogenase small subunit
MQELTVTVNGRQHRAEVDERTLLLHFLRDELGLTGTHNGCLEARCGCCAVLVNGQSVKSCNVLALQVDGAVIRTVENLAPADGGAVPAWPGSEDGHGEARLSALQETFKRHGAVQCGFCTPGMLIVATDFLQDHSEPNEEQAREAICGNLCRCTGYQKIVDAIVDAGKQRAAEISFEGAETLSPRL